MKVLIVFNHPAPYKVKQFNAIGKVVDLTVLFERTKAKNRPDNFYSNNKYNFKHIFFYDGYYGNENSRSRKIKQYIEKFHSEYDTIIMNGYSTCAERKAIKYLRKNNIPFILMVNGGIIRNKESRLRKWYKTRYISLAKKYLSPSPVADEYLKYYGANPKNIYHYTYSSIEEKDIVSTPLSQDEKNKIRKILSLPVDKFIYIAPNQFISRKNNVQMIRFFKNRDEILLLIGMGEEKSLYEEIIKKENINNVFIFDHMSKQDLFEYYKASNAVISFSKEDIFGHTVLEGFACGLPSIISNKVISALTLIKNGENGYIIPLEDENRIEAAFNNIDKCDNSSCIKKAKENTIDMTIDGIIKCIEQ